MKRKNERISGVLLPVSSLYGDYSIGSFGRNAIGFTDFLKECGFKCWQVLPFAVTDSWNSPYSSYSAFGGNPYFVDLEKLCEKNLITYEELNNARQRTPYVCEYERLRNERLPLLFKAASRVGDFSKVSEFIASHKKIAEFCEFMALKDKNGQRAWREWQDTTPDEYVLKGWQFIQYEFFNEWAEIKKYANENGISIIGDIPFYVSFDSCDVKFNKKLFMLDERENPAYVAGVPPDYFCEDGQLWGNPLYDWAEMEKDGFK